MRLAWHDGAMEARVALLVAAMLAGCAAPTAPPPDAPVDVGFDAYRDCSGAMAGAYAADCEDPRDSGRYAAPSASFDEVPEGWTCRLAADYREVDPDLPAWWLWSRPAALDDPTRAIEDRHLLGFQWEIAPRNGPVEVVLQLVSQTDAPILRWTADEGHGFAEIGVIDAGDEVAFDGVVVGPTTASMAIDHPPSDDDQDYGARSGYNATAVDVDRVEQSWGRHSRKPSEGWEALLYPTNVVTIGAERRYLPTTEYPELGGEAVAPTGPRNAGLVTHGIEWSDAAAGTARIQVQQAMHMRFDGYLEDLGQATGCRTCFFGPSQPDPVEFVDCATSAGSLASGPTKPLR
jgi:hypothetical protein